MSIAEQRSEMGLRALVHPTAIVDPGAILGDDVRIGPHAILGPRVEIGDGCTIGPSCVLEHVRLGKGNTLHAGANLGGPPQDLQYRGGDTLVVAGDRNTFREGVTVHRGSKGDTVIGSDCLLMATCHVAHDCKLGDGVILANGALLAGYVEVGSRAFLSALAAVHQFCRIGELAMVAALTAVAMDVLPYCTANGQRARLVGLNLVGLRRARVPRESIAQIKAAYKTLFHSGLLREEALARLSEGRPCPEVQRMIEFCRASRRSITRPGKGPGKDAEEA